jgi:hypothetical protein
MQFLVLGYDDTDDLASERRMKARADHIRMGDVLLKNGNLWYGAALLDENKDMIGSMYMMNFPDRTSLDAYLKVEPYVIGGVWKKIDVLPCVTRDPWQFNRPEEFFLNQ